MANWTRLKHLINSGQKDTLTEDDLKQNVTTRIAGIAHKIPDTAFWNCGGLTSVTIPSSVDSIENNAFP